MSDCPFPFSPKALAETVASKRIAELEALGGLDGLAQGLQTDLQTGLGSEIEQSTEFVDLSMERYSLGLPKSRIDIYGINRVSTKKVKGILELMIIASSDKVLVLLCIVASISLVLGLYQNWFQPVLPGQSQVEWVDSLAIISAVLIVVITGAVNDYQKEKQFARLLSKVYQSYIAYMLSCIFNHAAGELNLTNARQKNGLLLQCDPASLKRYRYLIF